MAMTEQEKADFLERPEVAKLVEEYAHKAINDWDVGYISKRALDDEGGPHRGGIFMAYDHDKYAIVPSEERALAQMRDFADGELKDLEEGYVEHDFGKRAKYAKVDSGGNIIYAHRSSDLESWWDNYLSAVLLDDLGIDDKEKDEIFVNAVRYSPGAPLR